MPAVIRHALPVHRARRFAGMLTALALAAVVGPAGVLVPALSAPPARAASPDFPAYDSRYHSFPEMIAEIQQAEADHPEIVDAFTIGKSYEGRDIWAAKISDNVATDEPEPEVLVDALHHAREHFTVEQALALLGWLTDDYGTDETVTRLVDSREIWIVFALNPDGFEYDLTGNPYRAWRKNRQPNSGSTAVGTDLNRNYDYKWGCCGGSSGTKSSITYRGPKPFSAPETRAMRDFVNGRRVDGIQQIRTHVSLHTNGQLILWPYGHTYANIPGDMTRADYTTFVALGRAMAALNGYKPQQSSDLYITDGDMIDWMYGRHRIFSYTMELFPPETATVWGDHYPADEHIATQTERNRGTLLLLIDRAACPYEAVASLAPHNCGPLYDDIELNRGWVRNPDGTDTATSGAWQIGNPQANTYYGPKQLDAAASGSLVLVTGALKGRYASSNDLDGRSTVRSGPVALPADTAAFGDMSFWYYFAHRPDSSSSDWFRAYVEAEDGTRTLVHEELGAPNDDDAAWAKVSVSVDAWAGQTIRIVFQAQDAGTGSLVEAAVDDVRVAR